MTYRIADTFTASLARLTSEEQKAVKTTAFDLQVNPANPGMSFHKLEKAKDRNFWSVRVNKDIRLIVHKMTGSLMLCYVDHHDKAYAWAERRKLEVHPTTGAAQLVEVRERIEEIAIPVYVSKDVPSPIKPSLFADASDETLLAFGVPVEWLAEVRGANEDSIFEITEHLPQEAAEALLDLATGTTPRRAPVVGPAIDPFEHPDAQRRFRVVTDVEELTRALDFPWDKWTVFLHPAQREIVERELNGPARVSGSAGTGKTVVALHRAVFLAKANPEARVLLATFSETLGNALRIKLRRLISNAPRLGERIEVHSLDHIALRLYARNVGTPRVASQDEMRVRLEKASTEAGVDKFSQSFLLSEWEQVVDAWRLSTWEAYRDVARLGRRTRLPEKQRAHLWSVFESVSKALLAQGMTTLPEVYERLTAHLAQLKTRPFEFVVVDEAQDVSVPQLRFLAALGGGQQNGLFFAGDLGQRIFQQPFSWLGLGVDVRGRSSTLRINYRTSHQIRRYADRLLDEGIADVDGIEERRGAVSVFNGPAPSIKSFDTPEQESVAVGAWLAEHIAGGVSPTEIGVFVRSSEQLDRARIAMKGAGIPYRVLDDGMETVSGSAAIGTMHLAKGLEFRTVAVMACDDEVVPLQERIEAVTEESDLEEVYKTERHLLYVACTRARDHLMVSSARPASEFLEDMLA